MELSSLGGCWCHPRDLWLISASKSDESPLHNMKGKRTLNAFKDSIIINNPKERGTPFHISKQHLLMQSWWSITTTLESCWPIIRIGLKFYRLVEQSQKLLTNKGICFPSWHAVNLKAFTVRGCSYLNHSTCWIDSSLYEMSLDVSSWISVSGRAAPLPLLLQNALQTSSQLGSRFFSLVYIFSKIIFQ